MSLGRQAGSSFGGGLAYCQPAGKTLARIFKDQGAGSQHTTLQATAITNPEGPPATHLQLCQLEAPMQLVFAGSGGRGAGIMGRFLRGRKAGRHAYWQTWHGSMGWKLAT
jgi:hypothetical protein